MIINIINLAEKEKIMKSSFYIAMGLISGGFIGAANLQAAEYPIGKPKIINGMEIAAVYLQPIEMEPAGMMGDPHLADIHLEADIHATADNKNGFADGEWMPYLDIHYTLKKLDNGQEMTGEMMPMVASDGPHYGDNVKLMGPGRYLLSLTIMSPADNQHAHFGRHVDPETGVDPWFKTFTVEYDFVFAGVGKKGGY